MSLGDYLRYLRAKKGGPTPWEIQEATGVPSSIYRHLEQRYREVGDDETIDRLAEYFGVPAEELRRRRPRFRKALSMALLDAQTQSYPLRLILRSGHTFEGMVEWWDLGAVLLHLPNGKEVIIQRHMVDDWLAMDTKKKEEEAPLT